MPRETDPLLARSSSRDASEEREAPEPGQPSTPGFAWLASVVLLAAVANGMAMYARYEHYQNEFCPQSTWSCGTFKPQFHLPGFTVYHEPTVTFAGFVVSFISAGWWSRVGDQRGRKLILLLPILGTVVFDLLFLIVAAVGNELSDDDKRDVLSIGFIVRGLLGGWATFGGAVYAYVADIAESSENRMILFAAVEALSVLGVALGGGLATATHSFKSAYGLSIAVGLSNLAYAHFLLPNTTPLLAPATESDLPPNPPAQSLVATVFLPVTTFFRNGGRALPLMGLASYLYSQTVALDSGSMSYTEEYAYSHPSPWLVYLPPRILALLTLLIIFPAGIRYYTKRSPSCSTDPAALPLTLARNALLALIALIGTILLFCHLIYSYPPNAPSTRHAGAPILYAVCFLLIPLVSALPGVGLYALAAAYVARIGRKGETGQLFAAMKLWAELGASISYAWYYGYGIYSETSVYLFFALVCLMPNPPEPEAVVAQVPQAGETAEQPES
ncbi:putative membrane protein C14C4.07 [Mycena kentingensis (nom. inval.)]|nr:putative membrane protein C14C4.07 [Mycena kentingensis (nom. inval.)]